VNRLSQFDERCADLLRRGVLGLAAAAGAGVVAMMAITCTDVLLRMFRLPLRGSYDLVSVCGTVSMACALPYITAVKGHAAIEYFLHKLNKRGRFVVDLLVQSTGIALFALLARECLRIGANMHASGQVSITLQLPLFWLPWLVAVCCAFTAAVLLFHLTHPGKQLVRL
jgi:TRAP-type C4-dicarboxylate transport system permease small subunit